MQLIGEIGLFPVTPQVPDGWAVCAGQLLDLSPNLALYSIIGSTYGGTMPETFALPNIPAPAPGVQYLISLTGLFPSDGEGMSPD